MSNHASTARFALLVALGLAGASSAQSPAPGQTFDAASETARRQLDESLAELARLREEMAADKIPLSRRLTEQEDALSAARQQLQQVSRTLDTRTLDVTNLRSEITRREGEIAYLSNLLGEYIRNFESGLHIAELQRYRQPIEAAKLAAENTALADAEIFARQAALLSTTLDRLGDAVGGTLFEGTAVDASGLVRPGTFLLVGPTAIFRTADGSSVGTAEQRLGSLEPNIIAFASPEDALAASALVAAGSGQVPIDPTLGSAHKVESTKESFLEHAKKGGPVMIPIVALAAAAFLVVLYKWLRMLFVRSPSRSRVRAFLATVATGDREASLRAAKRVGGPTGRMLFAGAENLGQPREFIEEVMFEEVLTTRLKLNRWLPFVAIAAASAPLLGLLGTVTGIMNTFKLITVFGTGDAKSLSGGISEALVTTEFGLIVAIPSLLLHAFLSRKARGIVDQMEKTALAFLNQLGKAQPPKSPIHAEPRPEPKPDGGVDRTNDRSPDRPRVEEASERRESAVRLKEPASVG